MLAIRTLMTVLYSF